MARRCKAKTAAGTACKVPPLPGKGLCRWHSDDREDVARRREAQSRGGHAKAYGAVPAIGPLADDPRVSKLNLETAGGLTAFLAAALRGLARLPFDARTANAIGQLATAQRSMIESGDLERRVQEIEAKMRRSGMQLA